MREWRRINSAEAHRKYLPNVVEKTFNKKEETQ